MNIYLDVDGTLSDFWGHATSLGVEPLGNVVYLADRKTWTEEQHDRQRRVDDLMGTEDFWLTMPFFNDAHELIAAACARAKTYLLTAYPSCAKDDATRKTIHQAKLEYCTTKLHFPVDRVIICQREDKVRHATNPDLYGKIRHADQRNLLVDDAAQNCSEWRAGGGHAIEHQSCHDSVYRLKDFFAR